jgi:large subunit ribosomal protein L1
MASKRFKKLPEKTSDLPSEVIEKLIPEVKKIVQPNLMNLLI